MDEEKLNIQIGITRFIWKIKLAILTATNLNGSSPGSVQKKTCCVRVAQCCVSEVVPLFKMKNMKYIEFTAYKNTVSNVIDRN